jgi:hypothetical protein
MREVQGSGPSFGQRTPFEMIQRGGGHQQSFVKPAKACHDEALVSMPKVRRHDYLVCPVLGAEAVMMPSGLVTNIHGCFSATFRPCSFLSPLSPLRLGWLVAAK